VVGHEKLGGRGGGGSAVLEREILLINCYAACLFTGAAIGEQESLSSFYFLVFSVFSEK